MKSILIEVRPIHDKWTGEFQDKFEVSLVRGGVDVSETHYDKVGTVPIKWLGDLTAEEIGQELGGN